MSATDRDSRLQELCRRYLLRLRPAAERFGLGRFVDDLIEKNVRNECAGTEDEVRVLSRACDDERLSRKEVPDVMGKSYRKCIEDGDFEGIERLHRVGIYSKISAILRKEHNTNG